MPPSQRPERQFDEVARAIARQVEESKPEKPADDDRPSSETSRTRSRLTPPGLTINSTRSVGGKAPDISTKRPKKG